MTDPVAWGVDAASKVALNTLASVGATFVCCYLAPATQSWKVRTPDDVHAYLAGGYDVVFNWESDGTPDGGWNTGVAAAQRSVELLVGYHNHCASCAAKIGVTAPVIFTFADMGSPNLTDLGDAMRGAASVIGLGRTGGYGGYDTVKWLFDQKLITYGWQTYGWSAGRRDPRAQLYQRLNTATIDYDVAYAVDFGQVPRPFPPEDDVSAADVWNAPIADLYTANPDDVMPAYAALAWATTHAAFARAASAQAVVQIAALQAAVDKLADAVATGQGADPAELKAAVAEAIAEARRPRR